MSDQTDQEKRAAKAAETEARAKDAAAAMRDYENERLAVIARTEKLRALRLAKEASEAAGTGKARARKKSTSPQ